MPRQEKVLDVRDLTVDGDKGNVVVNGISFDVYRNEIFRYCRRFRKWAAGVGGGHYRTAGGKSGPDSHQWHRNHQSVTQANSQSGVSSHVPEERIRFGIAPNLLLYENAILKKASPEDVFRTCLSCL